MQRPTANDFDHASLEAMMERYRAELLRYQRATPPGKPTLSQNLEASERGRTARRAADSGLAAGTGTEAPVRPAPPKAESMPVNPPTARTEQANKNTPQPDARRERVVVDTPPVMMPHLAPRLNTALQTQPEAARLPEIAEPSEAPELPRPPEQADAGQRAAGLGRLPAPERQARFLDVGDSNEQLLSAQEIAQVPKLADAPIPQSVLDSTPQSTLQNVLPLLQPVLDGVNQIMPPVSPLPQPAQDSSAAPEAQDLSQPGLPVFNPAMVPPPTPPTPPPVYIPPVEPAAAAIPQRANPPVQRTAGGIVYTEFEKGIGAYGTFRPYERMGKYTLASFLQTPGEAVQTLVRFAADVMPGSADAVRCRRSFTVKFFCREGAYDLFGLHLPVTVGTSEKTLSDCRDAFRANPKTGLRTRSAFWEFLVTHREALHAALWLYSDLGTIGSYRAIDGYGLPCLWVNAANERRAVRPRWLSRQRPQTLTRFEAEELAGSDPDAVARDLVESLQSGERPQYELSIQIIESEQFATLPFDPFDPTAIWPIEQFKPQRIGLLTLERLPDDTFAELDSACFSTEHLIPGIEPAPAPAVKSGDDFTQVRQYLRSLGEFSRHRLIDNLCEELLRLQPLLLEQVLILFSQADLEFGQAMTLALGG